MVSYYPRDNELEPRYEREINLPVVPKEVTDAMANKNWPLAIKLAIDAGARDHNALTNLVFFARHPELPPGNLDPNHPNIKQLAAEWSAILNKEVWTAIQRSSVNNDLKVMGHCVTERVKRFWGKAGVKLKALVVWAAKLADINPGLLGAVLLAEFDDSKLYLTTDEVTSFTTGADNFYEQKDVLRRLVPNSKYVRFDETKKFTERNEKGTLVTTIPFKSGRDAVLATAVYLKQGELKVRLGLQKGGGDFDKLPVETRLALVRLAMAAGHGGIDPNDGTLIKFIWDPIKKKCVPPPEGQKGKIFCGVAIRVDKVLKGNDILVRKKRTAAQSGRQHAYNQSQRDHTDGPGITLVGLVLRHSPGAARPAGAAPVHKV